MLYDFHDERVADGIAELAKKKRVAKVKKVYIYITKKMSLTPNVRLSSF